MRRLIDVLVLATAVWFTASDSAMAGTYDVYGCRLPNGTPIPADGWAPHTVHAGGDASNYCAPFGGLSAALHADIAVNHLAQAGWVFDSPPNTTIAEYALYRSSVVSTAPSEERGRGVWLYHDAAMWERITPSRYAQTACVASFGCLGEGDTEVRFRPRTFTSRLASESCACSLSPSATASRNVPQPRAT